MGNIIEQGSAVVNLGELRRLEERDTNFNKVEATLRSTIGDLKKELFSEKNDRKHTVFIKRVSSISHNYHRYHDSFGVDKDYFINTDDDAVEAAIAIKNTKIGKLIEDLENRNSIIARLEMEKDAIKTRYRKMGLWDRIFNR